MKLAKDHHIEENLFYGDGLDRIYNIIGDARLTRWLSSVTEEDLSPKETWLKFIAFLEKEQKLQQQKLLIFNKGHDGEHSKSSTNTHPKPHKVHHSNRAHHSGSSKEEVTCAICNSPAGTNDHISTNGPAKSQLIQYFTCQKFAELTPADRLSMLKKKGYCIQCLFPGANTSIGRHKDGKCQREFTCPHQSHLKYPVRKHVLVCEEHKDDKENQDLLENYKQRCMKNANLPDFARNISISFHAAFNCKTPSCEEDSVNDKGIYLLQNIRVNDCPLNIFYDNGCSDFIVRQSVINTLGDYATKLSDEPIQLGGVAETSTVSTLGTYNVRLPLFNGNMASLSGICLESITSTFPMYPLDEAMKDIQDSFNSNGNSNKTLPRPSPSVA